MAEAHCVDPEASQRPAAACHREHQDAWEDKVAEGRHMGQVWGRDPSCPLVVEVGHRLVHLQVHDKLSAQVQEPFLQSYQYACLTSTTTATGFIVFDDFSNLACHPVLI